MAESIFEFVAERLQEGSGLDKLESRGTLRIALKAAGLDAHSVTPGQMSVMLLRTMPGELSSRGVEGAEALCRSLAGSMCDFLPGGNQASERPDSPEDVFRRLGRDR